MEKPIRSPFTIEDIHKLREYDYHFIKKMISQERQNFYYERGRALRRKSKLEDLKFHVLLLNGSIINNLLQIYILPCVFNGFLF